LGRAEFNDANGTRAFFNGAELPFSNFSRAVMAESGFPTPNLRQAEFAPDR